MRARRLAGGVVLCVGVGGLGVAASGVARGQCQETWLPGGRSNSPPTRAMTVWDRASGPVLVVAGHTSIATSDSGVAAWNGTEWEHLGGSIRDGEVWAVASTPERLLVGGVFSSVGGSPGAFAAMLTPTGWETMPGLIAPANSVAFYRDQPVVGAWFNGLQGGPHAWDGSSWRLLGAGVNGNALDLEAVGDDLYAAGQFTSAGGQPAARVARWDGGQWHALGSGLNGTVWTLEFHNGVLYAGGEFTQSGATPVARIAAWSGSAWVQVGEGSPGVVRDLVSTPSGLLALEQRTLVPSLTPARVRRWDGAQWAVVSADLPENAPRSLAAFDDAPYVGTTDNVLPIGSLVRWTGASWVPMGDRSRELIPHAIDALPFEGRAVVAGEFDSIGGIEGASIIAAWDGDRWEPFSPAPEPSGRIVRLLKENGALYAVGYFDNWPASAPTVGARWNGAAWEPFGSSPGGSSISDGAFFRGELHVDVSDLGMNRRIARAVGPTLETLPGIEFDSKSRFVEYAGMLCMAVGTASIGSPPVMYQNAVVGWDGSQWHVLADAGVFAEQTPWSLAVFEGRLLASGQFSFGDGLAAFDGSQWQPFAPGLPPHPHPSIFGTTAVLRVVEARLFAFGLNFDCGQPAPCGGFAEWDGSTWSVHSAGPESVVSNASPVGDELFVLGSFTPGSGGLRRASWARWGHAEPRACPADVTGSAIPGQPGYGTPDGQITPDDFFYYLDQFTLANLPVCDLTANALPTDPCYGRADGVLNNDDFFYFLAQYAAGC
ncbi:MAG: GC-type dockerin domain-anchored protein [Phycisphaerales bacterium]